MKSPNTIYNLDYELLTTNQDDETKNLIQHLGLGLERESMSPQNNRRSVATAFKLRVRKRCTKVVRSNGKI